MDFQSQIIPGHTGCGVDYHIKYGRTMRTRGFQLILITCQVNKYPSDSRAPGEQEEAQAVNQPWMRMRGGAVLVLQAQAHRGEAQRRKGRALGTRHVVPNVLTSQLSLADMTAEFHLPQSVLKTSSLHAYTDFSLLGWTKSRPRNCLRAFWSCCVTTTCCQVGGPTGMGCPWTDPGAQQGAGKRMVLSFVSEKPRKG